VTAFIGGPIRPGAAASTARSDRTARLTPTSSRARTGSPRRSRSASGSSPRRPRGL
jgi:hypothetical protein